MNDVRRHLQGRIPIALTFIFLAHRITLTPPSSIPGATIGSVNEYTRLIEAAIAYSLALLGILPHMGTVMKLASRAWPYFLFVAFAAISAMWSEYPFEAVKYAVHCIGAFLIAAATAIACAEDRRKLYGTLHITTLILIVVSVIVVFVSPLRGTLQMLDSIDMKEVHRWRGITDHPNVLGAVCLITVWSGLALRLDSSGRLSGWLTAFSVPFALFVTYHGTKSMTAFASEIILVGIYALLSRGKITKFSSSRILMVGLGGGLLILVMLVARLTVFDLLHRESSLSGRTVLWQLAFNAIEEKPFLGWSFDENKSIFASFAGKVLIPEFHNGYLDFIVKGGLVGTLLLGLYLYTCTRSTIAMWSVNRLTAITTAMLLFVLLVANIAESFFFVVLDTLSFPFFCVWIMNEYQLMQRAQPAPAISSTTRSPTVRILGQPVSPRVH